MVDGTGAGLRDRGDAVPLPHPAMLPIATAQSATGLKGVLIGPPARGGAQASGTHRPHAGRVRQGEVAVASRRGSGSPIRRASRAREVARRTCRAPRIGSDSVRFASLRYATGWRDGKDRWCRAVPAGAVTEVILEVVAENPQRAGDKSGRAVGELAGATAGQELLQRSRFGLRSGRCSSARDLPHRGGDGGETVDARSALGGQSARRNAATREVSATGQTERPRATIAPAPQTRGRARRAGSGESRS